MYYYKKSTHLTPPHQYIKTGTGMWHMVVGGGHFLEVSLGQTDLALKLFYFSVAMLMRS